MKHLCLIVALTCAGCIPVRTKDSVHHVIIGFGVVSTPRQPEDQARVVKTQYLGVMSSQQPGTKFGVGYGSSMSLIVPTNADIVLEVSDGPFQPVKVENHE